MNRDVLNTEAKTPARSSEEIKKQLADLAIVREAAGGHGTPDFASTLGMQSIRLHQDALRRELRAAEMLESGTPDRNEPPKSPAN